MTPYASLTPLIKFHRQLSRVMRIAVWYCICACELFSTSCFIESYNLVFVLNKFSLCQDENARGLQLVTHWITNPTQLGFTQVIGDNLCLFCGAILSMRKGVKFYVLGAPVKWEISKFNRYSKELDLLV